MARNKTFSAAGDLQFKSQEVPAASTEAKPQNDVQEAAPSDYAVISASDIIPSPFNEGLEIDDLDEYVRSIKESGLIEPISVYSLPDGKFEILSGHQRYEAWCHVLGNDTIRAVIQPYEKDPVKRFKAHTEANTLTRSKNLKFWLSRIEQAKKVLAEAGFSGTRAQELEKISELLNGVSTAQLYRYESFKKLIPDLQELESKNYLSANTLYAAVSLDAIQQKEVRKRVDMLQAAKAADNSGLEGDLEISREEFKKIVSDVRKGVAAEPSTVKRKRPTYGDKITKAADSLISIMSRCRSEEDREEARNQIRELRLKLDELEKALS